MSKILFTTPVIAPKDVAVYQSDTLDGIRTEACTLPYSALSTDATTGKKALDHANIDPTKHRWVYFISDLNEIGPTAHLNPAPVDPAVGELTVNLALWDNTGLQPVKNAEVKVEPYVTPFRSNEWVGTDGPWITQTDTNGIATLFVPTGIKVKVSVIEAGVNKLIIENTVSAMNLADYL